MEEEIIKTDKTPALLPALGILGLGIGTVALVLGIFAMKKSGDISESMSDKIEKAAALSLEIKTQRQNRRPRAANRRHEIRRRQPRGKTC